MQLKEVLLVGADRCGQGGRDDGRPQVRARLDAFGTTSDEELVIDLLRRERVKSEAWIASKIRTLR
jgi:hypothetical protein